MKREINVNRIDKVLINGIEYTVIIYEKSSLQLSEFSDLSPSDLKIIDDYARKYIIDNGSKMETTELEYWVNVVKSCQDGIKETILKIFK